MNTYLIRKCGSWRGVYCHPTKLWLNGWVWRLGGIQPDWVRWPVFRYTNDQDAKDCLERVREAEEIGQERPTEP